MEFLVLVGIACFIVGLGIGALLARQFSLSGKKTKDMEQHLQESETKLKSYQQEVNNHFEKTAQLLAEMNNAYREVHNHLADSSHKLTDTPSADALIKTIPTMKQLESITEAAAPTSAAAPLDYAPKNSPYEKGMLDESFGIESKKKAKQAEEEAPPVVI